MKYEFKFEIIKDISGDATLKAALRQQLSDKIQAFSRAHVEVPIVPRGSGSIEP